MEFGELNEFAPHKEFPVFNAAELVVGIAVREQETIPVKKSMP